MSDKIEVVRLDGLEQIINKLKAYVEAQINQELGDIGTVLDQINGEVA